MRSLQIAPAGRSDAAQPHSHQLLADQFGAPPKRKIRPFGLLLALLFCLLTTPVWAQDEITQVSYWSDQFGDQGSFWKVVVKGKTYVALKLKSPDKAGEANVVLDKNLLTELEQKALELKSTPNNLKNDGFQVVWSKDSGDSKVRTLLGCWHGIKVKLIQVEENKDGKKEHQISLDKGYNDFQRALKKAKPLLDL